MAQVERSLRAKLILGTILTLLSVVIAILVVVFFVQKGGNDRNLKNTEKTIAAQLETKGMNLTANQAMALKGFAVDLAMGDVLRLVKRTVHEDPEIVYGVFIGDELIPWAMVTPDNAAGIVDEDFDWKTKFKLTDEVVKSKERFRALSLYGGEIYEYAQGLEIDHEFSGSIRYGISTSNMRSALQEAREEAEEVLVQGLIAIVVVGLFVVALGSLITRVQATRITEPLGDLTAAANKLREGDRSVGVKITSGDELEVLANAFNDMALELKASYETLEQKVTDRTHDLRQKTDDINNMLQNMHQGIFTIMHGQRIHHEYSKYLEQLLDTTDIAGREVMDVVFVEGDLGPDVFDRIQVIIDNTLGEDEMNFLINEHLFLTEFGFVRNGKKKILQVDWNPIVSAGFTEKIMVTLRDVTELRELEEEMGEQKRRLEILGQILAVEPDVFQRFLGTLDKIIERNREIVKVSGTFSSEQVNEMFRNIHTVKGNARTYQFTYINDVVHVVENTYRDLRAGKGIGGQLITKARLLNELDEVEASLNEYRTIFETDLKPIHTGLGSDVGLSQSFADQLLAFADSSEQAGISGEDFGRRLKMYIKQACARSLRTVLESLVPGAKKIAEELNKPAPRMVLNTSDLKVPGDKVDLVRDVFMHIFRNAVDHGLEKPSERLEKGKAPRGLIMLNAEAETEQIVISIQDDGRGIDLGKLSEKA
ncbi:MAG: HAMP domain-containing protein, partial [Myxococcota bacterium]|nr:HAMP domain-containing protein [Myxococcota bacterium]